MLNLLGLEPSAIIRKKEKIYKELDLKDADKQTLIAAMSQNPRLIERPILIKDNKAVLGRPIENISKLLEL